MKMNSLVEFTELLKNRLSDILFQEVENDRYINLYLADGYWTAFEKSAYRLCRIYGSSMLLPMRLTFAPFPFVTASIMQDEIHTALSGLTCRMRSRSERIYLAGIDTNMADYQKWHDKVTFALRNLPKEAMTTMNG